MDSIDRKISEKFEAIEERLRNSFQAMRADIASVKEKIESKERNKPIPADSEAKREIEFLREKLGAKFSEIDEKIRSIKPAKSDDSALKKLTKQISSLKNNIASKDDLNSLKDDFDSKINSVKKQVSKTGIKQEISKELNDRLSQNLDIIAQKLKESKTSLEKNQQDLIKNLQKEQKGLISGFEKEVKKIRERTEKEKQELEEKFLKEQDEKINNLQRHIYYLKSQLKSKQTITEQLEEKQEPFKWKKVVIPLIILIPLILIGYIFVANFVIAHDFNSFYDIGSQTDAKTPYLTPLNRVSGIGNEINNITYRNLTSDLVYFTASIPKGSDNITIQVNYKTNLKKIVPIKIGAQNNTGWNYTYSVFNNASKNNQWTISSTPFNLKDLYINNGKLNMFFNIPMGNSGNVEVDWINITVHKDGIF